MANSLTTLAGDGSNTIFSFSFGYLDRDHVSVFVDGAEVSFSFITSNTLSIVPAPSAGSIVRITRTTPTTKLVDFQDGETLSEEDLDKVSLQGLYIAQETADNQGAVLTEDTDGAVDAASRRIKNAADPSAAQDLATKSYVDTAAASQAAQAASSAASAGTSATNAANAQAAAEQAKAGAEAIRSTADSVVVSDYVFTAAQGQTSFTGADSNTNTLAYFPGNILVLLNGVLLISAVDYTAADGSSITLTQATEAGDQVIVKVLSPGVALTSAIGGVAYSQSEKDKLQSVASGAEVNLTGTETVALLDAHFGSTGWRTGGVVDNSNPPILSTLSTAASGADSFTASVSTDTANGTIFWAADTTDEVPTQSQIKLGLNEAGANAQDSGNFPVTATGSQAFFGNGVFAPGFEGVIHVFHERPDGGQSAVLTSSRFTMPAAVPGLFAPTMWGITETGNAGEAAISINTLPAANGSALTTLQYQIAGGSWTNFGTTALGTYPVTGFTDGSSQDVAIRAVNSVGEGAASATKAVTTVVTNSVPAGFTAPDWTLEETGVSGVLRVNVLALPADNGSPIVVIQRSLDGGGWSPIEAGANSTGFYDLTGLTDGVSVSVRLRAVNSNGASVASDTKSATPVEASAALAVTLTGDGEVQIENAGTGSASITISGGSEYDGTYAISSLADLADGPLSLVAPVIQDDGSPEIPETLTKRPGLWVYDTANGPEPTITQQWQNDDAGDSVFANIGGATGNTYALTSAEGGDDVRVQETATQGADSRTESSADVSIPEPSAASTDAALTDTFSDTNDGQVYTLTGVDIGVAAANRKVVVMFGAKANTSLSSVTIGGVTATALHAWDTSSNPDIAVYEAAVPTGTTADIVVTFDNTNPSGIFGAAFRYTTGTASVFAPVDGQTASVNLTATISGAGAFVAGLAVTEGNSATGWTWTGLANEALDVEFRGSGTDNVGSVAWESGIAAGSRTITATADGSPNSGKSLGIILEVV